MCPSDPQAAAVPARNPDWAGAVLTISLDAIAANWRTLAAMAPAAGCGAVVKANGYGLGAVEVARRLHREGCRDFFVAHPAEGMAIRPHIGGARLYILNGLMRGCAPDYAAHGLTPVLNDMDQVAEWAALCRETRRHGAALHIDTGMNRLGLTAAEADALAADPAPLDAMGDLLVMSHMACADEPDHDLNARQLDRFRSIRAHLAMGRASLANSSAIYLGPDYHFDLLRPGVALYGGTPRPGETNPMLPVVRLSARILQLRDIGEAGTVGYGATHDAAPPTRIATVAAGYADGILRSLGNRGRFHLAGHEVPLVGRVSMDLITVDVSAVPEHLLTPDARVDLLDDTLTVDDLAREAGTIGYEILTSLGARYRREYLGLTA